MRQKDIIIIVHRSTEEIPLKIKKVFTQISLRYVGFCFQLLLKFLRGILGKLTKAR